MHANTFEAADGTLRCAETGREIPRVAPKPPPYDPTAELRRQREEEWEEEKRKARKDQLQFQRNLVDNPPHTFGGQDRLTRILYRLLKGIEQDADDVRYLENFVAKHPPFDDWESK